MSVRPAYKAATAPALACCAAMFMIMLDTTIVNVVLPDVRHALGASLAAGGWAITAYALAFGAFVLPLGQLADGAGAPTVLTVALAGFGVSSAACAAAPSVEVLVALRALQGVSAAALAPSSLSMLLAVAGPEGRGRALALWTAAGSSAGALGPTLGGALAGAGAWRLVFLVNVPVTIAAIVALAAHRPADGAPREAGRRRPDLGGSLLAVVAIGAPSAAVSAAGDGVWAWAAPQCVGAVAVGVLAGALLARRATRHPRPALDPRLWRRRAAQVGLAGTFAHGMTMFGLLSTNVLFLRDVWDLSPLQTGLAVSPSPILASACALVSGRLVRRAGARGVALSGALLLAGGCLLLAAHPPPPGAYLTGWLPAAVLTGAGNGLAFPALSAVVVGAAPGDARGAAGAAITASRQLAAVLGIATCLAVLGPAPGLGAHRAVWALLTACALGTAAVAGRVGRAGRVPA